MMKKLSMSLLLAIFSLYMKVSAQEVKSESMSILPQKQIPASVFFELPIKTMVTVSPDGSYLAYLSPWKNTLNLFVEPINGGDPVRLSAQSGQPVHKYHWISNQALAFQGAENNGSLESIYIGQLSEPENPFRVSSEGMDAKLLSVTKEGSGVFYYMQKKPTATGYDLFSFDFIDKNPRLVYAADGSAYYDYCVSPDNGRIVAMDCFGEEVRLSFMDNERHMIKVASFSCDKTFIPVAFDGKNKTSILAISNVSADRKSLVSFDYVLGVQTGVIWEDGEADFYRRDNNFSNALDLELESLGSAYGIVTLNSDHEKIKNVIAEKLGPQTQFILDNVDDRGNVFVLHTVGARVAPVYYRYNVYNNELKEISNTNKSISPNYLVDIQRTSFVNRTGSEIQASVVLPHTGSKQAPVVIYLPENPYDKFFPEYHPEIQLLANNGFVVWIVDFSGSFDYAKLLCYENMNSWAERISSDLIDAVKHLIVTGTAHPERISLFANGFSGLFAMSAMSNESELFSSGVFVNAIFDLNAFLADGTPMKSQPNPFWSTLSVDKNSGGGIKNFGSVVAGDIQVKQPLFFAFSNFDKFFPATQSNSAAAALTKSGNIPEIFSVDDSHELDNIENKVALWDATIDFLKRNSQKNIKAPEDQAPSRDEFRRKQ